MEKIKTKLEEVVNTAKVPTPLDRKPGEGGYEYLKRAVVYMSQLPKYKETLR